MAQEQPLKLITTEETTPQTPEEKAITAEIAGMPDADKEKLGLGLSIIGYRVEKMKDNFFVNTLNLSLAVWGDKRGTTGRFITELKNSFVRDAEEAEKKGLAIQKGENKSKFRQVGNVGMLTGNVLKYGRIVADVTGASIANPLRYVMMGGMITARAAEAGKEARFKSDKLLEKTQIQDAEVAAEEAWKIYENAGGKVGDAIEENGVLKYEDGGVTNVSTEALKNAYLMEMPADIQERLEDSTEAYNFVGAIMRKQIGVRLNRLQKKIEWIGFNKWDKDAITEDGKKGAYIQSLSPEQIEIEKQKLLESWKKELMDYDRMITRYGTVDQLAMTAKYAQTAGKAVVLGMQIETAYKSLTNIPKLWEHLSHMLSSHSEVLPAGVAGHLITENKAPTQAGVAGGKPNSPSEGYIERAEKWIGQQFGHSTAKLGDGSFAKYDSHGIMTERKFPDGSFEKYDHGALHHFDTKGVETSPAEPAPTAPTQAPNTPPEPATSPESGTGTATKEALAAAANVSHHEVATEFSVKLGENGVPKNLETVFNAISADHMDVPADGVVNQEFATKSLNMAANLVKLTEGHGAVGVTAEEWGKAANFWDGKLEIKDHQAFNDILSKLQEHANQNWTNGVLQGKDAAAAYVPNISHDNWLKILHADGLHETGGDAHAATGILGHQEVTGDKIADFGPRHVFEYTGYHTDNVGTEPENYHGDTSYFKNFKGPIENDAIGHSAGGEVDEYGQPKNNPMSIPKPTPENVRRAVLDAYGQKNAPLSKELVEINTQSGIQKIDTHVLTTHEISEKTGTILRNNPEFLKNPSNLTPERLIKAYDVGQEKITEVIRHNNFGTTGWRAMKDLKVTKLVGDKNYSDNNPMIQYLNKLRDTTNLKPQGTSIFHRAETVKEYIARALQRAAKIEKLSELENWEPK